MPLDVIGTGFGRTGTMSLKCALERLGFGPCYHMSEIFGKPDHIKSWIGAVAGADVDWTKLFEAYRSVSDWPACTFWKGLLQEHSSAKVVLTTRDYESWYQSINSTVFFALGKIEVAIKSGDHSDDDIALYRMARELIVERTFSNDLRRENVLAVLAEHEADVVASVPEGQCLVYDVADGWDPLCLFLDCSVPDEPFPHLNSTADFREKAGL